MVNFKDFLEADIKNTFFNVDEFAEEAIINDIAMPIVPDEYALEKYNLKAEGDGLARGELLFYAPADKFVKKPFHDMPVFVGKKKYSAVKVSLDGGVYEIVLGGFRS